MNTISDKEIKRFFEKAKQESVPDNGFSRKVMSKLPTERRKHPVLVWTFGIVGVLIAYFSGAFYSCLASLAYFGYQLSKAHIPEHNTIIVYLFVLGGMIAFSVNFFRKSWS